MHSSPEGTAERKPVVTVFQPSLRDFTWGGRHPCVETLGYLHLSHRKIHFQISERQNGWPGVPGRGRDRTQEIQHSALHFINTITFAAIFMKRSTSGHERKSGDVCGEEFAAQARREVLPHGQQSISRQWICKERATPPGSQRTAARRVAPHLAWGFVARRSQPHWRGMLLGARAEAPRASPQAKWGATNVTGFTLMTT